MFQVVVLADSALLSSSGTPGIQEAAHSRRSVYTLAGLTHSDSSRFFIIHPESQLYPASLSDAPPAALLFIETVTQSIMATERPAEETVHFSGLTYMRHVSTIQWGSQLESSSRLEFFDWLSNVISGRKSNPVNRKKRLDSFSLSPTNVKRVKRQRPTPMTPVTLPSPNATNNNHSNFPFSHINETTPTVSRVRWNKRKLKRLAARRRRKQSLTAAMQP